MSDVVVSITRLPHGMDLPLPGYETAESAGMDIRAAVDRPIEILPGGRALIPQIRPRSGLALKKGITLPNSPGTIDADYRGEVGVILLNAGEETFTIERGDRIAQMVIAPVLQASWNEVESLDETARGEGGFGSTGVAEKVS